MQYHVILDYVVNKTALYYVKVYRFLVKNETGSVSTVEVIFEQYFYDIHD